jgi:tetratricopeptide (TPR) repeat protein
MSFRKNGQMSEGLQSDFLVKPTLVNQKFEDALRCYQQELSIALVSLNADAAELAYAYHHVALAFHALGRPADASENYSKAEVTLALARDHIGLEELKPKSAATLKQIRANYLLLLKQTGQTTAAAALEKRIQSAQ